jgi:chitinase
MIGQNDIQEEIFTLDDAEKLRTFAIDKGMRRLSMWSANRDIACSLNYTETQRVSDSCSGIPQQPFEFASTLKQGFEGSVRSAADTPVTANELQNPADIVDDPATSPYQIWSEAAAYLQGTKVVWRKNVYEAKWWTRGDIPDNPVLQTWETPWKLVGPVLPGETPVQTLTLPAGTYPEWNGESVYDTGARVLFKGTPYEAKWWTKGASPEAASSNPDSSPWVPLTQEQINQLLPSN